MTRPFAIDFRSIPPVRFDHPQDQAGDAPEATATAPGRAGRTFLTRTQKRRMTNLRRAAEVIDHLPGPGESLHGVLKGFFDLMHLLIALLDKLAVPCEQLRIATLSVSPRNVSELAALLDTGKVKRIDVLTSDFQAKHDPEIMGELLAELGKRGQRVAAARSHCKIVLLALADGRRYVLEGSANLRTSRNQEQFALCQDGALHDFYAAWFDEMVTKHALQAG
jgi:hypothetical protein